MTFRLSDLAVPLVSGILLSACQSDPDQDSTFPQRDCSSVVWMQPSRPDAQLGLTGSWNGWHGVSVPAESHGDGVWFRSYFLVPPGEHGYLVVEDGVERLDAFNPLTTFRGTEEVSLLLVEDCSVPTMRVEAADADDEGRLSVRATFLAATGGNVLEPSTVRGVTRDGTSLAITEAEPATGSVQLRGEGMGRGKHTITLEAADTAGGRTAPARASIWVKPSIKKWQDAFIYQIMVDRYRGDGGQALSAPSTPGSRAGGTLGGVRAEVERGTFEEMGVSALWLSPVYTNPTEPREGRDDNHLYEGYHGYWPLDSRAVDPRIGGDQALVDLIEAAHQRGIRVLLDVVPNHVYERNPVYLEHSADGWFHEGAERCVCGDSGCGWDTHIDRCWFTPYLPDFRWQHPDVMRWGVEETRWWAERFDVDGVRIDAVPMMPRATTRRLAHALRTTVAPSDSRLVLGEVFTGQGQGGIESIRYHLGPDGLDSAFDFPLMWAVRDAFSANRSGFDAVERVLASSEEAFDGSGAIMARIIGNHDITRFVSEANGDAGGDPWDAPPVQPLDPAPYDRLRMALVFSLTIPGIPVVYYGDEVGLAGGGDPDCRRVMPPLDALDPLRGEVLETVRVIGRLRRCSNALRRGERRVVSVDRDTYSFVRDAGDGHPVVVMFSKAALPADISITTSQIPAGGYVDVMTGESFGLGAGGEATLVNVAPLQFRVLATSNDPCL